MKKNLLKMLAFVSIMAMAACKKETSSTVSIVGKWNAQRERVTTSTTFMGQTMSHDTTVNFTNGEYIEFASNGTIKLLDDSSIIHTGTYTFVNNRLSWVTGTDSASFNVDLLDAHNLNLSESYSSNDSGVVVNNKWYVYLAR